MNYEQEFECYAAIADIERLFEEIVELMAVDFGGIVKTVSGSIDSVKKLTDIALQTQSVELREGILGLREQLLSIKESLLEAKEENSDLREENKKLKQEIKELQDSGEPLVFKDDAYFANSGDGPFCSRCYDSERKTIRLITIPGPTTALVKYVCPECKTPIRGNTFKSGATFKPPSASNS